MAITQVQQIGGKYQEWAEAGKLFVARSGAAAAIPINSTLTNSPTLWNVGDSGKKLIPLKFMFSFAAIGTQAQAGLTLSRLLNTGAAVATGLPIATFTNIAPVNMKLGSGLVAKSQFANGTVTFTAQPTAFMDLGVGQNVQGTAANGEPYTQYSYEFDGELVIPSGVSISIGATAATSGTYFTSILFAELDEDE